MNTENILLSLILIVLLIILRHQRIWMISLSKVLEEREQNKRGKHDDIGVMIDNSQFKKALMEINSRIKHQGEHKTLLWYQGQALYHLQKWADAKVSLTRAIELEPTYKDSLQPYLELINEKIK